MDDDSHVKDSANDDGDQGEYSSNTSGGSVRDINSKRIFEDPVLCAQFLRDYVDVDELKNVSPDDIQDVSARYHPYLGVEFQSDTVNRIRLYDEDGKEAEEPLYLVSLIEHKSDVDYDVAMQILRYMVCIWQDYAKEENRRKEHVSKRKYFRYPPILPIVYYEGAAKWTAGMHLRDRIRKGSAFGSYIPDFVYEVVRNHDYTNAQLLEQQDEISLLMMINKIQNTEDFREFCQTSPEAVNHILENTTPSIRRTIRDTLYSLLMKMNMPVEEANEYAESVEECRMGYLFENMEKIDIQAERRYAAQARQEADAAKQEADAANREADAAKQEADAARQEADAAERRADAAERRADAAEQKTEAAAARGAERLLLSLIEAKLAKGKTEEQIAEDLLETPDRIRELRNKIK
ncbi:MAG: Rpn family recombination-promoting nuclease/putative transposase [Clostridiales bacterium]|nr:Rpn family recombination-promoting nuclease/putative transposase [Clostridiales bacterium]